MMQLTCFPICGEIIAYTFESSTVLYSRSLFPPVVPITKGTPSLQYSCALSAYNIKQTYNNQNTAQECAR